MQNADRNDAESVDSPLVLLCWSNQLIVLLEHRDDTSGEDAEDKEPIVAFKGRSTANSQGRRKGRITRSMTSEVEETAAPLLSNELGQSGLVAFRLLFCTISKDEAYSSTATALV